MSFIAIAKSLYDGSRYCVLTNAKREAWDTIGRHRPPKLFPTAEKALKGGQRMTFRLTVEVITEEQFMVYVAQARRQQMHEAAEEAWSHDYLLACGDKER